MKKKTKFFFNMLIILILILLIIGLTLFFVNRSNDSNLKEKKFEQKFTSTSKDIICQNFKDCLINIPKCSENQIFQCDTKECITPEKCNPNLSVIPYEYPTLLKKSSEICSSLTQCYKNCISNNGSGLFRIKNSYRINKDDINVYLALPYTDPNLPVTTFKNITNPNNLFDISQIWYLDMDTDTIKFFKDDLDLCLTAFGDTVKNGSIYETKVTNYTKDNTNQRIRLVKTENTNEYYITFGNNLFLTRDPNTKEGTLVFTTTDQNYFSGTSLNKWIFEPIKCCSSVSSKCYPNLPVQQGLPNLSKICSLLEKCDDYCILKNSSGVFRIKNKGKVDTNDNTYLTIPQSNIDENIITIKKNEDISSQLWYWDSDLSRIKFLENDTEEFYLTSYGDTIKGGSDIYKPKVETIARIDSQRINLEKTLIENEFKIKFLNDTYLYRDPKSEDGRLVFTSSNPKYFDDDTYSIWIFEPIKCCSSTSSKCYPNLTIMPKLNSIKPILYDVCSKMSDCEGCSVNGNGFFTIENADNPTILSLENSDPKNNVITYKTIHPLNESQLWYINKDQGTISFFTRDQELFLTAFGDTISTTDGPKDGKIYRLIVMPKQPDNTPNIFQKISIVNSEDEPNYFNIKFGELYLYLDPYPENGITYVFTSSNNYYFNEKYMLNKWILNPVSCCTSLK